jgi:hypothetical protein
MALLEDGRMESPDGEGVQIVIEEGISSTSLDLYRVAETIF